MSREFFNERAAIWDQNIAEKDERKLVDMARRLDIGQGARVLDVGTGTGVFLPFLLQKVGERGSIIALDFAEEMLRRAKEKFRDHANIEYMTADIAGAPFLSSYFDVVVCYSVFPHFQDKLCVLRQIYRVLRSGGRVFICHTSGRHIINEIHRGIPAVCHDTLPGKVEMQELLAAAGFNDITVVDARDSYLARAVREGQGE